MFELLIFEGSNDVIKVQLRNGDINMSIQFDEYIANKFEIYGKHYSLIEPENTEKLMEVLKIQ